ncbi:DoxX family membrane protein [Modestobacter sp. I12A-02628]|uniref:DoxX family membrane protein n=1 Tax=Goekera deserti TaxID=2497753 RepID=A0A7K3WB85_9ACTN|nr:DoxX family membrane protein [Goekera deserti]MPQ97425.1 DoxX family membrane protein [Goekera deserti]NDI47974.1 DoxX family membrane protein [Goekera deserti]NEL53722.1 DoxX family membrane protein [Goekera deserti]
MAQYRPRILPAVARVAAALVFLDGGRQVWAAPAGPAQGAGPFLARLRAAVPALGPCTDEQLVRVNAGVHVGAGAALALGLAPRLAAGVLTASLAPTTLAVFSFWDLPAGPERTHARAAFLKNLAVAGGLLGIATAPPRPGS